MPRAFTRTQALQNAAFLRELRRTGNARDAARTLGAHRATFTKRRAKHPAFAADWDAALATAHATLGPPRNGEGDRAGKRRGGGGAPREEPRTVRLKSGRLQLRRAQPGRLTRAAEQAFLAALSATANVRLSAAAAGFSHSAFYYRAKRNSGFAREMRLALEMGCERLELALLESTLPGAHADDAWRHNDPPAIPPMTADQALQLLHLHNKTVHLQAEPPHIKRRRGEGGDAWSFRLAAMAEANRQRDRENYEVAEAERRARGEPSPFEPLPPVLPDLGIVAHAKSKALRETTRARPASAEPRSDDAGFARGRAGEGIPDRRPTDFAREPKGPYEP